MGNKCCHENNLIRKRLALLLVGLDNAGKTVTAKGLAGEQFECPIPTIGFSVIELKHAKYDVQIFDLGGGSNIRGIWHKYFVDVHGVIFVIDSCDTERFHEVTEVLEEIISNDKIRGKPLLILANKQDKESALDEIDLIECLKIEELVNKYKCPTLVQSCCANESNYNHRTDPGIWQGYEWIVNCIDKYYEQLNIRVKMDIVEQEIKEQQEMLAKLERIRLTRERINKAEDPDAIQTYSEYQAQIIHQPAAVEDLKISDFYGNPEELELNKSTINSNISSSSSRNSSTLTFPEIYYVQSYNNERERPKSAFQIVKHQLQLNGDLMIKRAQSAKVRRNKTAPIKEFNAKEFFPVKNFNNTKNRAIKSATTTERIFTISAGGNSVMGPGGDFFAPVMEKLEIQEKFEIKKNSPSKNSHKENGICIIDIE